MSRILTERDFAIDVVRRLREAGHESLWAGGCVRDQLLGKPPKDYDVATSALPEQVRALFRRTIAVGMNFGVIEVLGPRTAAGPLSIEVATFRSDVSYSDGRRPDAVVFSSPEEDAQRRDFTINGMFFDPLEDRLIDYVGGRSDLEAGVIRAIGEARSRFEEDKLRMLRAVRMASRFEFQIESATETAVREMASQIQVVSAERIADELHKILLDSHRSRGVSLFFDLGLASVVLPELCKSDIDALSPIARVLDRLPAETSFPLGFAAVLHFVGDNPKDSARSVRKICERLKLSNEERDRIEWLVANQDSLLDAESLRLCRLKTLLAHPGIDELLQLHAAKADALGEKTDHVRFCKERLDIWDTSVLAPAPLLTGHDLMELGLSPGPVFKRLLDSVREAQLDETIHTREEALTLVDRLQNEN